MRCDICKQELGPDGRPNSFCEWQQGRCPHQKEKLDKVGYAVVIGMFTLLFFIIWLTI
jgi:hypothetical protein